MANPLTVTQLKTALGKWFPNGGYEFWPGAVGRPGTFAPKGFTVHHTGGPYTDSDSYMNFLFITGRPDEGIPGQLCQFAIGGSGKLYIGNLGRANHAGKGSSSTRSKIVNRNYPGYVAPEIDPGVDDIDGNAEYYGVEICYPGTLPMRDAQYATAVRLGAMIVDTYGWNALGTFGHREHTERKGDPGKIAMYQYRRDVRALLAAGPGGDDMTPDEFLALWRPIGTRIEELFKEVKDAQEAEVVKDRATAVRIEALFTQVLSELGVADDKIDEILAQHPVVDPAPN